MAKLGDAVCFDTAPLIWGVRGESSRGQEHQIERTKQYIRHLQATNKQIMVPAPVLTEYLVGASATEFHELEILKHSFQIPSLDVKSAHIAAELQRGDAIRIAQEDFGIERQCVKVDALIIAIAIANQASRIVTHDVDHFKALARGRILISTVPNVDEQPLFPAVD